MKLNVKMTLDEFEEYLAYRKDAERLRKDIGKDLAFVRGYTNDLAFAVFAAIQEEASDGERICVKVRDEKALESLFDLAVDWNS